LQQEANMLQFETVTPLDIGNDDIEICGSFEAYPPESDFIWPGFMAGTVGALVAPGATGKSFWALEAAMSIACSVAGGDLMGLHPERSGRVRYFAGEDPRPELIRRVYFIGQHLSAVARKAVAENMSLSPIMGRRLNIMNDSHLQRIIELSKGARLVVLDTLSRIHGLDENSNGEMGLLIATLEHIAESTGAAVSFSAPRHQEQRSRWSDRPAAGGAGRFRLDR